MTGTDRVSLLSGDRPLCAWPLEQSPVRGYWDCCRCRPCGMAERRAVTCHEALLRGVAHYDPSFAQSVGVELTALVAVRNRLRDRVELLELALLRHAADGIEPQERDLLELRLQERGYVLD